MWLRKHISPLPGEITDITEKKAEQELQVMIQDWETDYA